MTARTKPDTPLTRRQGMVLGAIWSFASVGWIAGIMLVKTWYDEGISNAFFWFGIVLLFGAVVFVCALVITLLCELLNITTPRSRRDALNYFSWALLFTSVIGGISMMTALQFR